MSYLFYMDESGHDHKKLSCRARGTELIRVSMQKGNQYKKKEAKHMTSNKCQPWPEPPRQSIADIRFLEYTTTTYGQFSVYQTEEGRITIPLMAIHKEILSVQLDPTIKKLLTVQARPLA